jgi:3-mercaptopyruvate sulfurtransferase SseA
MLDEVGVKSARALLGGYNAWVASGYPVVKSDLPK